MDQFIQATTQHVSWNKGKLVGQKAPLKLKDIWAIRVRLQIGNRTRELALFNRSIWRSTLADDGHLALLRPFLEADSPQTH